jgi:aconitate hydratase
MPYKQVLAYYVSSNIPTGISRSIVMNHNLFNSLRDISLSEGRKANFYSLAALEAAGLGNISRLPVSIRIVLESVLRNCDGNKITEAHVRRLAGWKPNAARLDEIPFVVITSLLQDFTGVPLLVDLAAMRSAAQRMGKDLTLVEPLVPVDLVVDHSVQVDHYGDKQALAINMEMEFRRNSERYQFIKWGMQAFNTFKVVPPGIGIVHQVNLEYLAPGVNVKDGVVFPDTLVGTGFAHHHDQQDWRGRLGCRRDQARLACWASRFTFLRLTLSG